MYSPVALFYIEVLSVPVPLYILLYPQAPEYLTVGTGFISCMRPTASVITALSVACMKHPDQAVLAPATPMSCTLT